MEFSEILEGIDAVVQKVSSLSDAGDFRCFSQYELDAISRQLQARQTLIQVYRDATWRSRYRGILDYVFPHVLIDTTMALSRCESREAVLAQVQRFISVIDELLEDLDPSAYRDERHGVTGERGDLRPPKRPTFSLEDVIRDPMTRAGLGEGTGGLPVDNQALCRTPHMDFSGGNTVRPGQRFEVRVYANREAARQGEQAEDIILVEATEAKEFEVRVQLLVTNHFAASGEPEQVIIIEREKDESNVAHFAVVVKSAEEVEALKETPPAVAAAFSFKNRPSGKVSREIAIDGLPAVPGQPPDEGTSSELRLDSTADPADMTVTVIATNENDGRHFWCTVQTPLLPKYTPGVTDVWNLSDSTYEIVNQYMAKFTAKVQSRIEMISALKGAGIRLFEDSPKVFQEAFWSLIDAKLAVKSLSIVSSEPYIPWELMVPKRVRPDGTPEKRLPLGVEFAVGRWTRRTAAAADQHLSITSSYAIAPQYKGSQQLPFAQVEARFVTDNFRPGDTISPATFQGIVKAFAIGGRTLLHIACHGVAGSKTKQTILLEDGQSLDSDQLLGLDEIETALRATRPLVFLNACEVGRLTPALVGVGGFAQSFIDLQASAVIAPLWSVKDTIAHAVAQEFYITALANPNMPFAEILRGIRAKAYDPNIGEDTYAAYCFYGDPLATGAR